MSTKRSPYYRLLWHWLIFLPCGLVAGWLFVFIEAELDASAVWFKASSGEMRKYSDSGLYERIGLAIQRGSQLGVVLSSFLLCANAAAIWWRHKAHSIGYYLRFGLFGLLLFISAVAIFLGLTTTAARNQSILLAPIRELGGNTLYNFHAPGWVNRACGDDFLSEVVRIELSFTETSDDDIERILPNLSELNLLFWIRLTKTNVTDGAVHRLQEQFPDVTIYHPAADPTLESVPGTLID